jgi:putative effector of murein hydrolase LrgA (UPF0299 family)
MSGGSALLLTLLLFLIPAVIRVVATLLGDSMSLKEASPGERGEV